MADGTRDDVDEVTEPMLGANVRAWLSGELSPSELWCATHVGWDVSTEPLALAYLLAANGDWGRFAAALLSLAGVVWGASFGSSDGVARTLRSSARSLRAGGPLVVPVVHAPASVLAVSSPPWAVPGGRAPASVLAVSSPPWAVPGGRAPASVLAVSSPPLAVPGGRAPASVLAVSSPLSARAAATWQVVDRAVAFALETARDPVPAWEAFHAALSAIVAAMPVVGARTAASELRRGGAPRRFRPTARDELLSFVLRASPELHP